jgi:hypothetical protein
LKARKDFWHVLENYLRSKGVKL